MLDEFLAVVFGLVSAVFMACGLVMRQRSTMHVAPEDSLGTGMATSLMRQPLWWAGTVVALGGFGFQALALNRGSLILVQPLLVTSLLFALPLSAHFAQRRVTRREWTWALLLIVGIALFVVLGHPQPGVARPPFYVWFIAILVVVPLVLGCVVEAYRRTGCGRAVLLAVAAAVLFAVVAVLTKVSLYQLDRGGFTLVFTRPTVYLLIVLAVVTTVLQQAALHAGALQVSVPTMIVLEPVAAVALGLLVLGENLNVRRFGGPGLAIVILVMILATIALARDAAQHEVAHER